MIDLLLEHLHLAVKKAVPWPPGDDFGDQNLCADVDPRADGGRVPGPRRALERELAFQNTYLTWNEEAQGFEDDLQRLHEGADGDVEALRAELDRVQERIDVASLNSEEWNVLYRLRLQLEHDVARRAGEKG